VSGLETLAKRLATVASDSTREAATEAARAYLHDVARGKISDIGIKSGQTDAVTGVRVSGDSTVELEGPVRKGGVGYLKYRARIGYGFAKRDRAAAVDKYVEVLRRALAGG